MSYPDSPTSPNGLSARRLTNRNTNRYSVTALFELEDDLTRAQKRLSVMKSAVTSRFPLHVQAKDRLADDLRRDSELKEVDLEDRSTPLDQDNYPTPIDDDSYNFGSIRLVNVPTDAVEDATNDQSLELITAVPTDAEKGATNAKWPTQDSRNLGLKATLRQLENHIKETDDFRNTMNEKVSSLEEQVRRLTEENERLKVFEKYNKDLTELHVVQDMIGNLNRIIFEIAGTFTETLLLRKATSIESDTLAVCILEPLVGKDVVEYVKKARADSLPPFFSWALCTTMSAWVARIITSWSDDDVGSQNNFTEIFEKIKQNEGLKLALNWRALTYDHFQTPELQTKKASARWKTLGLIVESLLHMYSLAGLSDSDVHRAVFGYSEKFLQIIDLASKTRNEIHRASRSSEISVLYFNSERAYDERTMTLDQAHSAFMNREVVDRKVVCAMSLGMSVKACDENGTEAVLLKSRVAPSHVSTVKAKALYSYQASEDDPNEISFKKHEILTVTSRQTAWWQVKKEDGTSGIAPSNYLTIV